MEEKIKTKIPKLKTLEDCSDLKMVKQAAFEWVKFIQKDIDNSKPTSDEYIDNLHTRYHQGSIDILKVFCNISNK